MNWFDVSSTRLGGIPFALDAQGKWRDVSEVKRGLACNCVCPECAGRVVAKKGEIRAHHFAHDDLRECRHALEASIFGVTVELLRAPGANLQLPGHGDSAEWLREARHLPRPSFFTAPPYVLPPASVTASAGFQIGCARLTDSTPARADLVCEEHLLAVHLLSHQKPYAKRGDLVQPPGWRVLAINLNHYVRLWWGSCDPDRADTVSIIVNAREELRRWLAESVGGRGFLQHPEEAVARVRYDSWLKDMRAAEAARPVRPPPRDWRSQVVPLGLAALKAEQAAQAAAAKALNEKWRIPKGTAEVHSDSLVYQAVVEPKPGTITNWLARELKVKWHPGIRAYVFVGRPGDPIPEATRRFLELDAAWTPAGPTDKFIAP